MVELGNLRLGRQNDNVFLSYFADNLRRNLLVSTSKQKALSACHRDDRFRLLSFNKVENLISIDVVCHQLFIPD